MREHRDHFIHNGCPVWKPMAVFIRADYLALLPPHVQLNRQQLAKRDRLRIRRHLREDILDSRLLPIEPIPLELITLPIDRQQSQQYERRGTTYT